MTPEGKLDLLHNYRDLVAKVDELCRRTTEEFGPHLACRPGCAACCRHITLSRVEGAALVEAVGALPAATADEIRSRARSASLSALRVAQSWSAASRCWIVSERTSDRDCRVLSLSSS